jgi:hypothetical protein
MISEGGRRVQEVIRKGEPRSWSVQLSVTLGVEKHYVSANTNGGLRALRA